MPDVTVTITNGVFTLDGELVTERTRTFPLADLFKPENKIVLVRALREGRHLGLREAADLADTIIYAGG